MARNNIIIIVFILLCSCANKNYIDKDINKSLKKLKENFGTDFLKDSLLSHFPEIINNVTLFQTNPPACPPSYDCIKQYGDVVLIVDKNDYKNELKSIIEGDILFKTVYSDTNIVLDLSELERNYFPNTICNKYYNNKMPIPFFESYDFGLGKQKICKEIEGQDYYKYAYVIPSDLVIFLIQAESGSFWKEPCNNNRPEPLKEWKNGYSKGIAISDKQEIAVFWTMIW